MAVPLDAERSSRNGALRILEESVSIQELARYYLAQGETVRAAGLMLKVVETDPTQENLTLLADIYMEQGLFEDAQALYLSVVKAGLKQRS